MSQRSTVSFGAPPVQQQPHHPMPHVLVPPASRSAVLPRYVASHEEMTLLPTYDATERAAGSSSFASSAHPTTASDRASPGQTARGAIAAAERADATSPMTEKQRLKEQEVAQLRLVADARMR